MPAPPDGAVTDAARPAGRPGTAALLAAHGLSKSYGAFQAVRSVDLAIRENDVHVFIGPNGAGKSTVLSLLGGQILPTAGEVYFDGRPLGRTTPSWRARAGICRVAPL